ncbi:MAG: hypothetical protein WC780_01155 [Lentimicrobiaceae bacterium]|jgi:hypothetical protein
MLRFLLIPVFLIAVMSSCNLLPQKGKSKGKAIARVYDKNLYAEDLKGIIPVGTNSNDSMEMTAAYINNWVRQELLLKQAEDNLEETNRDFSKLIEQYRNSLIIYAYESELVKQKLDTVVSMSEIENYYRDNQNNFHLRENIVLASYVITPKNSPAANKVKSLLLSTREADKEKLQDLCQKNGFEYLINDSTWMSFADFTQKIPLSVEDQEDFLNKNKYFEVKDSTTMYYVAILAYKGKDSISPLNFEIENIRTILLNKRKAELLKRMEEELFTDAVKNNQYEIFKK